METGFRVLRAEIKRSVIEKAFAICLSLCSWGMAIGSVCTTVLVASGRLEAGSRVATFPFSDLFPPSVLFVVLPTWESPSVRMYPPFDSASRSDAVLLDALVFFVQITAIVSC